MIYDIIIIGAGPAGMTAAIYSKQARKNVLMIEKNSYGGQIINANKVKNYPGFLEISGYELATKLYNQVKELDIEIIIDEVVRIDSNKEYKEITTVKGNYKAKSVIIAAGAKARSLGLTNEKDLIGKGISYCATCDGMFFKNKIVAVNGGGNTAIDDALYLSNICKKVYLIHRNSELSIELINLSNLKKKDNVEFILSTDIIDVIGKEKLEKISIKNNLSNNVSEIEVDGLFIAIGHIPVSEICNNLIETDNRGYIISNENCTTNIEGVFVAGDIRQKEIRQLTTACSDGTVAAINACKYINNL